MKETYSKSEKHVELLEVERCELMSENLKLNSEISELKTIYEEDCEDGTTLHTQLEKANERVS